MAARGGGVDKFFLVTTVFLAAILFGCREKRPLVINITTSTPAPISAIMETPPIDPTIATELTRQAPLATSTPLPTATNLPSGSTCERSPGWVRYIVQSKDTLYYLSQVTNSTVADLKFANCLLDDFLQVGQELYLPVLPPPPPQIVDLPLPQPTACASLLNCTVDRQTSLVRTLGRPNPFPLCALPDQPYIDATNLGEAYIGQRTYFFACHVPGPMFQSAVLTLTNSAEKIDLLLNPLLPTNMQRVVDESQHKPEIILAWDVACNTLAVREEHAEFKLRVQVENEQEPLLLESIVSRFEPDPILLVSPEVGWPGDTFKIHACQFTPGQPITVDLYYGSDDQDENNDPIFYFSKHLIIPINEEGWGYLTIESLSTDPTQDFMIYKKLVDGELEFVFTLASDAGE